VCAACSASSKLGAKSVDEQQVEIVGTAALTVALIREGFEVARPIRDRGIDLIVFSDSPGEPFAAVPVQVKVHSGTALEVDQGYERFHGLVYAVVWNAAAQPRFFLFDHAEAISLVPESSRETKSWTQGKHWTWTTAPQHLHARLAQYENRWDWLHSRLGRRPAQV